MTATLATATIDPLRPAVAGRWDDERVRVVREPGVPLRATRMDDGRIEMRHDVGEPDDDLAEALAAALAPCADEHDVFRRAFVGVVLTAGDAEPVDAWERFYRASLARQAGYAAVHDHALGLLPHTSVLDLGCSFGFLALRLAARGTHALASESEPGTAALLATMSARLGLAVDVWGDPSRIPDGHVDAVALLHVLEHVDAATGERLLHEATRIARRRVVVAVPYEDVPSPLYGHVRRMDDSTLAELGEGTAWVTTVQHHHGGWLVLDRP